MNKEQSGSLFAIVALVIVCIIFAIIGYSYLQQPDYEDETVERPEGKLHPVIIRATNGQPMVDTGKKNADGSPVLVRCNTCHDTKKTNKFTDSGEKLSGFHKGLKFHHGQNKCISCHNPDDYESLRLADGSKVAFKNSMQLCAQCHGPQYRDYKNGSHGGMSGHWDLTQGPRVRNSCVHCHDAHAPAYPKVMPIFPPKKRAGTQGDSSSSDHSH